MPRKKTGVPPLSRLLTTAEAVALTEYSARTLHRYAEQRRLTKYYLGTRLRWDSAELDALVTPVRPASVVASSQRMRARAESVAS